MSLNTVIINNITLGQILVWLGIGFGIYALAKCYRLLFTRRSVKLQHMTYFVCGNCGWEGQISKFGNHCPKCHAPTQS